MFLHVYVLCGYTTNIDILPLLIKLKNNSDLFHFLCRRGPYRCEKFMTNLEVNKTEVLVVIKYLKKKITASKEIHENTVQILTEFFLSYESVHKLTMKGRDGPEDDLWFGRLKTTITNSQVVSIYHIFLDDRRLTVQQIVKSICISSGSVLTVLMEILGMS